MKTVRINPRTQKRWLSLVKAGFLIAWLPTSGLLLFYMAAMNIGGSFSTMFVLFGAHVGYTSLLFNRARAHEDGPLRRRTLVAAEIAVRATVLFLGVSIIATSLFTLLLNSGYKPLPMNWSAGSFEKVIPEFRVVPLLASFLTVLALQASFTFMHRSLVVLSRRHFGLSAMADIYSKARKHKSS